MFKLSPQFDKTALNNISGEPVPYAYGVEFPFTKNTAGLPIAGLIDAIIENKERVTLPGKGSWNQPVGTYKAIGNGLAKNKMGVPTFSYNDEQIFRSPTGIGGGGAPQHCGKKRKR
jgi:hypothetical protein